ncbi:MAG TPA: hypothetical protein VHO26_01050 [Propionibacteriaceae bacterium]|nr:hypothetical protein [Propionibacteriaceae bacterium]
MADWRDGVEYAPTGRPYGFATPRAHPLTAPQPEPHPADDRPAAPPAAFEAPSAPPLAQLVPHTAEPRDPHEAFDTGSASFTGTTAWGTVAGHGSGGWDPTRPLPLSGEPASGATDFAPPTGPPVVPAAGVAAPGPYAPPLPQRAPDAAFGGYPPPAYPPQGSYPQGAYPPGNPGPQWGPPPSPTPARPGAMGWLLVLLLLGGTVIQSLSVLLLVAAALIVRRVQPPRRGLATAAAVGAGALIPVAALMWAGQPYDWFATTSSVSQVICFVLLIAATISMAVGGSRR